MPLYRMATRSTAADMASGVDPLTFVGSDNDLAAHPPGVNMITLLGYIANTADGRGLFYIDGQASRARGWAASLRSPSAADSRDSVSPLCIELGGCLTMASRYEVDKHGCRLQVTDDVGQRTDSVPGLCGHPARQYPRGRDSSMAQHPCDPH